MIKKVLVPTDFSACARAAEEVGLQIAKKANAEIHFLHLLLTPVEWAKLPVEKEKLYPETKTKIGIAKSELGKLRNKAEKLGLKAQEVLKFDLDREEIYRHIKDHQCDFIVMGSHGTKGLKEILGSNTQRVVRYSTASVMVVKKKLEPFRVKNIVFAANFKIDVHPAFLKVVEFANLMQAKIHLLYVNLPFSFRETDEVEADMQAFKKKCPDVKCSVNIYNALSEERGIHKFAEAIHADILALTTQGKTGFMKMISPSITESLVNHSDFPVLSVNIRDK